MTLVFARGAGERGALPEFGGCLLATGTVEVLKGKISPEGKCSVFFAPFLLRSFLHNVRILASSVIAILTNSARRQIVNRS